VTSQTQNSSPIFRFNRPVGLSAILDPRAGVTHHDTRLSLLHALGEVNYEGKVAVVSHRMDEHQELRSLGANLVLHPYSDAADRAIELLVS